MAKFDLKNQHISKTFQNLLQITGSNDNIFDLVGNPINQIEMSGSIVLRNTPTTSAFLQLDNYSGLSDSTNKLHARGGHLYWGEAFIASGSEIVGITSLVEDSTPQLGGFLDVNSNDIRGTGYIGGNIALNGSASFGKKGSFGGDLNVTGHITASGNISASGTVSAQSINVGGTEGIGLSANNIDVQTISASAMLIKSDDIITDAIDNFFLIKSGSFEALKVNTEGVLELGSFVTEPAPEDGAVYYNQTHNEFYLGK